MLTYKHNDEVALHTGQCETREVQGGIATALHSSLSKPDLKVGIESSEHNERLCAQYSSFGQERNSTSQTYIVFGDWLRCPLS